MRPQIPVLIRSAVCVPCEFLLKMSAFTAVRAQSLPGKRSTRDILVSEIEWLLRAEQRRVSFFPRQNVNFLAASDRTERVTLACAEPQSPPRSNQPKPSTWGEIQAYRSPSLDA